MVGTDPWWVWVGMNWWTHHVTHTHGGCGCGYGLRHPWVYPCRALSISNNLHKFIQVYILLPHTPTHYCLHCLYCLLLHPPPLFWYKSTPLHPWISLFTPRGVPQNICAIAALYALVVVIRQISIKIGGIVGLFTNQLLNSLYYLDLPNLM